MFYFILLLICFENRLSLLCAFVFVFLRISCYSRSQGLLIPTLSVTELLVSDSLFFIPTVSSRNVNLTSQNTVGSLDVASIVVEMQLHQNIGTASVIFFLIL